MPMDSACGSAALPALGFPIRESAGRRLFSASPRLIAAVHALLRLLVPRHPPCALPILTVGNRIAIPCRVLLAQNPRWSRDDSLCRYPSRPSEGALRWHGCAVFKVRGGAAPSGLEGGLSKLNSMAPRGE